MAAQYYSRLRGAAQKTLDVEMLLARYPRLDEQGLAHLIETFPSLPLIDKAVIIADEQLSERVAALYRDHRRELEAPIVFLFVSIIATSAALWWLLA